MRLLKKINYPVMLFCMIFFVLICVCVPYNFITHIFTSSVISQDEMFSLYNRNNIFFSTEFSKVSAEDNNKDIDEYVAKFKLFDMFTIKSLKIKVLTEEVMPGGNCIGISLNSKGIVLIGSNFVITKNGTANPLSTSELSIGDIIVEINNVQVNNVQDITSALAENKGEEVKVKYKRSGKECYTTITPALDFQTNTYKLGLWVRDNALGIGTLTFVKSDLRFGSLGHPINDADTKECFDVIDGEVYNSSVVGIKKGMKGVPGELVGLFMLGNSIQGSIDKNSENGVFGYINKSSSLLEDKKYLSVGGRMTAKPGKAQILSCIDGENIDVYDIEIMKTYNQKANTEKNMVIKITDKRLLEKTGGIVQGMSGSPIIQNGKIIGAVTHVFINDPTKGFGLYLDWMLAE